MPKESRLFRLPEFLPAAACLEVRAALDRGLAEPAEVFEPAATLNLAARRASSIEVAPRALELVEGRLDAVRPLVGAFHRVALAAREGTGFLRYRAGDYYRPHRDRAADADWPGAARRRIAVVVFLNSAGDTGRDGVLTGGELVLYPGGVPSAADAIPVTPRAGTLVAFDARMLHEVRPVAGGIRDVAVDWFY